LRRYPCDGFVTAPALQAWRGVRVERLLRRFGRWSQQVRLAPFSYGWIDNRGRRSPRELVGLSEPQVGERFTTAGGRELGRIVLIHPGKYLTSTIMGAFMSHVRVLQDFDATRLLPKIVMRTRRWAAPAMAVADLIIARRQLLNLKPLAERYRHCGPRAEIERAWTLRPRRRRLRCSHRGHDRALFPAR
jgi:hypothetical protein